MEPFHFKQFSVHQDRCAMKIGTDAVLLGGWTKVDEQVSSILDVGAGTGVLALMLAQRSPASVIDALEIDEDAFEQCVDNFEASPWADRLYCYHASLEEFAAEMDDQYDLIISNPPFYPSSYKSENEQRDLARFTDAMPLRELVEAVAKLLAPRGTFSVIVPFAEEKDLLVLASKELLYPYRITRVKGTPQASFKRSLIQFSTLEMPLEPTELTIEMARHQYTDDYVDLVRDFYLKM